MVPQYSSVLNAPELVTLKFWLILLSECHGRGEENLPEIKKKIKTNTVCYLVFTSNGSSLRGVGSGGQVQMKQDWLQVGNCGLGFIILFVFCLPLKKILNKGK